MPVSVTILGAAGRMGQALVRGIPHFPALRLAGALERSDCPVLGKDAGMVAGFGETGILITADVQRAAQRYLVEENCSLVTYEPRPA